MNSCANRLATVLAAMSLASPAFSQSALEAAAAQPEAAAPEAARADAAADLYCKRNLGTWFYCDRPKAEPKPATPASPASADAQLKEITRQLDELKAKAVLDPSPENVMAYVRFQREQLDRASTFADVWQRALWQNPELDYTLQRPVSTLGKRAWVDARAADKSVIMRQLSRRYGVFYFYAQSCAVCEVQAPILKSLADSNGLQVMAVSMDGGPNRVFPNYQVDTGQRARMGLSGRETPALVLFDTVERRPIPIGSGLMAADEIVDRIFALTNVKPGSDY